MFGRLMSEHGYKKSHGHVIVYHGIQLTIEFTPEAIAARRNSRRRDSVEGEGA